MIDITEFNAAFQSLTDNPPLSWQKRLFRDHFAVNDLIGVIDLPTGLGKTSVMAIWLIARMTNEKLPRRLIYVVDRRTVIDQATKEAEKLVKNWTDRKVFDEPPPAISTLRGQFADNRKWTLDPSRLAIVIGTVDLIGSGLLFSGYRSSYKRRPLEAGFLGQDSLLVLDEAHLSKPFEKLISRIGNSGTFQKDRHGATQGVPMRVVCMSATSIKPAKDNGREERDTKDNAFRLDIDPNSRNLDLWSKIENGKETNPIKQRFEASKRLTIKNSKDVIDSIATEAGKIASDKPGSRIVIFVKSPRDVNAVRKALIKKDKSGETKIALLTGTMRGLERDELVDLKTPIREGEHERRVMQRFLNPDNDPSLGECFLISTSAGEVGFDLNADHLVGDAAPLDSWIQRLGRVNRRGNGDAIVVLIKDNEPADKTAFDKACNAASDLLADRRRVAQATEDELDVSPKALAALMSTLTSKQFDAASSPAPAMVGLTDVLLDAWSMTSIVEPMPGRPEVGPWLRGIADDMPQTTIAWRAELDELGFAELGLDDIEEWFDTHRVLAHEELTVPTTAAAKWFTDRWSEFPEPRRLQLADRPIIIDRAGISLTTVKALIDQLSRKAADNTSSLRYANIIVPASFGGIERGTGLLDHSAPTKLEDAPDVTRDEGGAKTELLSMASDVGDVYLIERYRCVETRNEDGEAVERRIGPGSLPDNATKKKLARLRITLDSDDGRHTTLVSYVPKRERLDWGTDRQPLVTHVGLVREAVDEMLSRLSLPEELQCAARLAADWHDHGKDRERWQRCAGRREGERPLGKSGGRMKRDPRGYRHEFGSLRELADAFDAGKLLDQAGNPISQDVFDFAMHLVATHHGRGRPHFPKGGFDPDAESRSPAIHNEAIGRFARLQRKYGYWRLVWLENLLRCADALASADNEADRINRGDA